ncbi:MAG: hypothetical protein IPJ77_24995 [Planctomycetes bacterium]|nr:hypothetical protein [Planctomycetota bacterium]
MDEESLRFSELGSCGAKARVQGQGHGNELALVQAIGEVERAVALRPFSRARVFDSQLYERRSAE